MNYTSLEKITVESGRLPYQLILSYREGCIFSKKIRVHRLAAPFRAEQTSQQVSNCDVNNFVWLFE